MCGEAIHKQRRMTEEPRKDLLFFINSQVPSVPGCFIFIIYRLTPHCHVGISTAGDCT